MLVIAEGVGEGAEDERHERQRHAICDGAYGPYYHEENIHQIRISEELEKWHAVLGLVLLRVLRIRPGVPFSVRFSGSGFLLYTSRHHRL